MAGLSILKVVSGDDLAKKELEDQDKELASRQNDEVVLGLVGYLRTCWDAAKIAKEPIERIMLKSMRQRNGEYEPDKLNAINKHGGSTIYMMITEVKCRAAESWLRDILLDEGTPPWDVRPSTIPDLPDETEDSIKAGVEEKIIQMLQEQGKAPTEGEISSIKEMLAQDHRFALLQEAYNRAEKMKHKIGDQFDQGGWPEAFNDFITDIVTFPAAFIKGPIVRRQRTLGWTTSEDGKTVAEPTERIAPEYERVDPFRMYPEPGITNPDDGYCFQHHPLTRTMLSDLIGVPGYDEQAIRKVLDEGSGPSWIMLNVELQKEEEERKYHTEMRPTEIYDTLEFWGKVSGKMLREWGMTEEEIEDPAMEYDANVWICGNMVLKVILNYDPLGKKPYSKTSFIKAPGAFWGKGIPEIIEDLQGVCNASARALVNNMGIASGPQVEVNMDRIAQNEDITQVFPWKVWQVQNDPSGAAQAAIRFTQPEDNSTKLMAVYEKFSKLADDHSGIPSYLYGDLETHGAGRTSSGLSMLMGSAGKGIRQVIMHIDADITKPIVERQFVYNMRYDEDESIKGDVDIVPRGAINLAVKEQENTRKVEFAQLTANPIDMEIMGVEGRRALLSDVAQGLNMDADEIIPSREKRRMIQQENPVDRQEVQGQGPSQPAVGAAPLDPAGNPKGGQAGNTVSSKVSGKP